MLAVSADRSKIAANIQRDQGQDFELQVWDRATGKAAWESPPQVDGRGMALSPDSHMVAAYVGFRIALARRRRPAAPLSPTTSFAYGTRPRATCDRPSRIAPIRLAFDDTGQYLAAYSDGLRIIRVADGKVVHSFSIPIPLHRRRFGFTGTATRSASSWGRT
jgi:hypothetical protein